MKKILFLTLIIGVTLMSCSKKSNNEAQPIIPKSPPETIPILSPTTFAGGGNQASTDGTGTSAQFYQIVKLTTDKTGNIYVIEAVNTSTNLFFKIRKITPAGVTSTMFNGGAETFVNNVPVSKVKIYRIIDIAADPSGNVYVEANMIDYSKVQNTQHSYYQELGTYKLNISTGNLDKLSVSSTTSSSAETAWAAPYNLFVIHLFT